MQIKPTIRRQTPGSVHYGGDIATGPWVYSAYDGPRLICVAATAGEARRKYRRIRADWWARTKWGTGTKGAK
ncbi:MAG: hypothetical protein ACRD3L_01490 [Terriglobales bacterium]